MRVLLIKTSSMGDLIHTFPALTDAKNAMVNIHFDWVVEKNFADIPTWHPAVNKVIPIALRHWRKNIFARQTRLEWQMLLKTLRAEKYDLILDAQSLMKSAFLSLFTKGERVGLDFKSARESFASFAYQKKCTVNFYQHAVVRMRSLFSQALDYVLPDTDPDFGLTSITHHPTEKKYLVFLPGTTWMTKQWPESYWIRLANLAGDAGYQIKISGGNEAELASAKRIAAQATTVDPLPRLNISEMAALMANANGVVAVDTGFAHLAAALNVPTVALFGSTNPEYTGIIGNYAENIAAQFSCAPCLNRTCSYQEKSVVTPACFSSVTPERVWIALQKKLEKNN